MNMNEAPQIAESASSVTTCRRLIDGETLRRPRV
jgi:hypothetical protein